MIIKILGKEVNIEEGNSIDVQFMKNTCGFNIAINGKIVRKGTRWHPEKHCPLFGEKL